MIKSDTGSKGYWEMLTNGVPVEFQLHPIEPNRSPQRQRYMRNRKIVINNGIEKTQPSLVSTTFRPEMEEVWAVADKEG